MDQETRELLQTLKEHAAAQAALAVEMAGVRVDAAQGRAASERAEAAALEAKAAVQACHSWTEERKKAALDAQAALEAKRLADTADMELESGARRRRLRAIASSFYDVLARVLSVPAAQTVLVAILLALLALGYERLTGRRVELTYPDVTSSTSSTSTTSTKSTTVTESER